MPWFRLCMRHTLPQALSRVSSNRDGSDYACATRKSNACKAVAQWRSIWPRALLCACFCPRSYRRSGRSPLRFGSSKVLNRFADDVIFGRVTPAEHGLDHRSMDEECLAPVTPTHTRDEQTM
jgi:hypothetical protein